MDAETRFIADVMLGKLATWLRFPGGCVGYFPPERMSRCSAGPQEEVVFQERQWHCIFSAMDRARTPSARFAWNSRIVVG
jgi:uncharacterized protein with PIN domain